VSVSYQYDALRKYNRWRRGDGRMKMPDPKELGELIDGAADRLEEQALSAMGLAFSLSLTDQRRLKYLDRLDAYMWAEHHRPELMDRPDWLGARHWLITEWTDLERIAA
jgi:hypothetical protein